MCLVAVVDLNDLRSIGITVAFQRRQIIQQVLFRDIRVVIIPGAVSGYVFCGVNRLHAHFLCRRIRILNHELAPVGTLQNQQFFRLFSRLDERLPDADSDKTALADDRKVGHGAVCGQCSGKHISACLDIACDDHVVAFQRPVHSSERIHVRVGNGGCHVVIVSVNERRLRRKVQRKESAVAFRFRLPNGCLHKNSFLHVEYSTSIYNIPQIKKETPDEKTIKNVLSYGSFVLSGYLLIFGPPFFRMEKPKCPIQRPRSK